MINRTRVASIVAALALVSTCATAEGRTGGFGGGRAASFHGGFHRFAPRPVVRVAPVPRHAVTSGVALHRRDVRHVRHDGRDFRRHHRHGFGHRDTAAGVTVYYGAYDADDIARFGQSPAFGPAAATAGDDVAESGPICRSADQVVPRERGGQTLVTVTRCYPPNE
jgi:hypothetical protein